MATVNVAFFRPHQYRGYSVIGQIRVSENVTSNTSSQQIVNTAIDNEICIVTSSGGNIYIKVGENPTTSVGDLLVLDGVPTMVYVPSGHKLAIINS